METEKTFMTKTGFCHILPDKIVLTRDGIVGNVAKVVVGNSIARMLLVYSALACFLSYLAYDFYLKDEIPKSIFSGVIALYLIYGSIASINNSATSQIDRNKIKEVKFKKGIPGLTRSRFEIKFEDERGNTKKRLILLPGSKSGAALATEMAMKIMTEEKLI